MARPRRSIILTQCVALLLALAVSGPAWSQTAGSPALPAAAAGYVEYAVTNLPAYFGPGADVGAENNTPVDNPITDAGATLGRVLFYDQRLSHNTTTSCASCHVQENGFSDPNRLSVGFDGELTGRHSMGLSNAMFYANGRFFWDQRAATLEAQVLVPIENAVEMGSDLNEVRAKLAATDFYPALFTEAFGSAAMTNDRIADAMAQFVRSMASYQSKFDDARAAGDVGTPEFESQLTAQELLGSDIFHGSGNCNQCHVTEAQVGVGPRNIGLDLDNSADEGVADGRFKVPSLRNIEVRERFMHDGRFSTLEEVIEFYSTGIQANPNLSTSLRQSPDGPPIQFNFTQTEKDALLAFLKTLTDDAFLSSDLFSDPFVELAGDLDDNGLVDAGDLAAFQATYAAAAGASFLKWQRHLGSSWQDLTPADPGGANAIAEPSAIILLLAGCLATCARRRGRAPPID